jgi:hypothetical protein
LPSAVVSFDEDVGFKPAPRRAPSRKGGATAASRSKAGKRRKRKFQPFANGRAARLAAILMAAGIGGGTVVNALMMQKGHHPAPLFGKSIPLAPPSAKPTARAAAAEPHPSQEAAAPASATPEPEHALAPPPAAAPVTPSTRIADSADDPIARLLQRPEAKPANASGPKTVLAVQKALSKLGYPVKLTGTFGPATRKAAEAYERQHHLPARGELDHRLVKQLASESGITID